MNFYNKCNRIDQPMQKKKQFQLKTIHATGWIDPKNAITLHTFFNNEPKTNMRLKTHQSPRKKHTVTQEKDSNLFLKNTLVTQSQRKSTIFATEPKCDLKQFPKRHSVIKNGNAFRYFMHSHGRLATQITSEQQLFFRKLDQIIKEGPNARTIHKFDPTMIKDARINSKQQKKYSLPKQPKRRYTIGDNHRIEPWRSKQEQDFNDLYLK